MKKQTWQIALWCGLVVLALGIAARLWSGAFPVAAVQFPLTRDEVETRLGKVLERMGAPVAEYRHAVSFGEEETAKNYIERQYGPARLAEAAGKGVEIWYWSGRWFKPEQHEEYGAWADQAGNLVGYQHVVEEERALPTMTEGAARRVAEDFLKKEVRQHPLEKLRFINDSSEQRTNRTDWTFSWEQDDLRMGDAPYRLAVTVQGNEIGQYGEYLKVPQGWMEEYQRQRAVNELCARIAQFLAVALLTGMLWYAIRAIRNHQVRWGVVVPWPWLAGFGAVALAAQVNRIPEMVMAYPTTQSWSTYVAGLLLGGLRSVAGQVLGLWMLLLIADAIYRERLGGKSSFRRALGGQWHRDAQSVRALGVGIALATFALAYVCIFYVTAQKLGAWCPVDVDYSKTLSGWMPWVESMQTGMTASFGEELIFRVMGILLIWWLVRVRWLAVLLAAGTWAFLHSTYPQMPGYIRGVELTVVGVAWGVALLRYGIVATLTAHYLYDCWLGSLIAFQSSSWANKMGAVVVAGWPVALFVWACLRKGSALEPEEAHRPGLAYVPEATPVRAWPHEGLGLTGRRAGLMVAGCGLGLLVMWWTPLPTDAFRKLGALDLSRTEILKKADEALTEHGYTPYGYHRVATLTARGLPAEYLLEHGSPRELAALYDQPGGELTWAVRYFKVLQVEEFAVYLDKHGNFQTWRHTVLREAPGAQLSMAEALGRAKEAMGKEGINVGREELIRAAPAQEEHRRDWYFAFDERGFGWGEAKARSLVELQGAEAVDLRTYIKVPQAWLLAHAKSGWRKFAGEELARWSEVGLMGLLAAVFVIVIRKHVAPWRRAFWYALLPLGLKLANVCNHLPWFYSEYGTTTPLGSYAISHGGGLLEGLAVAYLRGVFMIAVTLGLLHWAWGWTPEQLVSWPRGRKARARYWGETLLVVLAGMTLMTLLAWARMAALAYAHPAAVCDFAWWKVEEWAPSIGALTEALQAGYDQTLRLAIMASLLRLVWGWRPRLAWTLAVLWPLAGISGAEKWTTFACELGYEEALLLVTIWLVLKVWRFNVAAVFLTYALASLIGSIDLFLRKGGPVYQWQALPLLGVLAGGMVAGLLMHYRQRGEPPAEEEMPGGVAPAGSRSL